MSKTSTMTLRLPSKVHRDVERLAAQLGYKPAHLGARLVEEGLRRRYFPTIDLRDTAAGRVAYLKGTRLAVYWIVDRIDKGMTADQVAGEFNVSIAQVNAALSYAHAFTAEIKLDLEESQVNKRWLEHEESGWQSGHRSSAPVQRRSKPRK
jgi:uncharacterized protein (DUF433 family)